jgi:hypothetical protein
MQAPLDRTPYPRDSRSKSIRPGLQDGGYVYVQDSHGEIWVLPDGPHLHPRILGNCELAMYAGDLTITNGRVRDVTNLSGTFQFDDPRGLLDVADVLDQLGFDIIPGAVRFFPTDGSRPQVLR